MIVHTEPSEETYDKSNIGKDNFRNSDRNIRNDNSEQEAESELDNQLRNLMKKPKKQENFSEKISDLPIKNLEKINKNDTVHTQKKSDCSEKSEKETKLHSNSNKNPFHNQKSPINNNFMENKTNLENIKPNKLAQDIRNFPEKNNSTNKISIPISDDSESDSDESYINYKPKKQINNRLTNPKNDKEVDSNNTNLPNNLVRKPPTNTFATNDQNKNKVLLKKSKKIISTSSQTNMLERQFSRNSISSNLGKFSQQNYKSNLDLAYIQDDNISDDDYPTNNSNNKQKTTNIIGNGTIKSAHTKSNLDKSSTKISNNLVIEKKIVVGNIFNNQNNFSQMIWNKVTNTILMVQMFFPKMGIWIVKIRSAYLTKVHPLKILTQKKALKVMKNALQTPKQKRH